MAEAQAACTYLHHNHAADVLGYSEARARQGKVK